MLRALVAFAPVAALLTVTPGRRRRWSCAAPRAAGAAGRWRTTVGNSLGVLAWGCFAAMASPRWSRRRPRRSPRSSWSARSSSSCSGCSRCAVIADRGAAGAGTRRPLRDGLVTSLANPKLAVFFVALFPQFVPAGGRCCRRRC
jgi:threonine/homoserine/homoserine lactone efflux protein